GSWLPAPVPDAALEPEPAASEASAPDARYGLAESATQAFLLALEALTPAQRAVLLLRDVYGASVRETAEATGLSEPNVKTTHHRARRQLAAYDASPCRPTPELFARVRDLLERFALAVAASDPARIAALFREDAELWSDADGEFLSNPRPVRGAAAIARFYAARSAALGAPPFLELTSLNHLPAALLGFAPQRDARLATRVALAVVPGPDGRIARLHNVVATPKLAALRARFPASVEGAGGEGARG
ncbi:MAG: RNA polymerase subunit sigma, partial [Myxococcales bacterium]|nr:RNA polymerase subunit sigma [Myxococcales bacterium]